MMNKSGVARIRGACTLLATRPDTELSLMAEIAVKAGQDALAAVP
ncbi:hypothetical protein [Candidatus Aalborgicola defluviihabitans]